MKFLKWYSAIVVSLSVAICLIEGVVFEDEISMFAALLYIPIAILLWKVLMNKA